MHRLLVAAAVVAGCSGNDGDGTISPPTTPTIPEDTSAPIDTSPAELAVDAAYFLVTARFAFDATTQQHVEFADPGTGLQPLQLAVTLMDTSIAYTGVLDATNSCEVVLEFPGPKPIASWVAANGAWIGLDVPGDATVRDGCRDYILPSSFAGDPAAAVSQWSWGIGVGPLDEDVEEQLRYALPASEWAALEPYIVGGALVSPLFASTSGGDGLTTAGFSLAYEVDGNFEIEVGGTGNAIPIPKEDVQGTTTGGTVATGYYEVAMGPFTPGAALTYR